MKIRLFQLFHLPTYLPTYLLTCLPACLPARPPTCPPTSLPAYLPTHPKTDGPNDWLTDQLMDWLTDWQIDGPTNQPTDWPNNQLNHLTACNEIDIQDHFVPWLCFSNTNSDTVSSNNSDSNDAFFQPQETDKAEDIVSITLIKKSSRNQQLNSDKRDSFEKESESS